MFEALFSFVLKLFFWLLGLIGSIIIYPVQVILVRLIPGLGDILVIISTFFSTYVFPFISFAKEVFLDVSCLPRASFVLLVDYLFLFVVIAPSIRAFRLILNAWRLKSGGVASSGSKTLAEFDL